VKRNPLGSSAQRLGACYDLRRMKKLEPEFEELAIFLEHFNKESERGAALSAGSLLDEKLKDILTAFLAEVAATNDLLSGFNAPIGTFSSRISASYAMGLIQEDEYKELNIIRKIRNEFGHSWQGVNFDSPKVTNLCLQLPWRGPEENEAKSTLKERFNFAVVMLLIDLLWRSRLVKKEQRVIRAWPHKTRP
jgi:mannitol operon repressor